MKILLLHIARLKLIRAGRLAPGLLLLGLLCPTGARATHILWTNTAGGNWNVTSNWFPHQVPSTNDTAWITNNGTYTVTLNVQTTLSGLVLGGDSGTQTLSHATYRLTLDGPGSSSSHGVYAFASGTLTGSGALTLNGPFIWTGGYLGSSGAGLVVTTSGGLTLSGSAKTLYVRLVNNGSCAWSAGTVTCYGTVQVSNTPAGTLDLAADGTAFNGSSGTPSIANAGTLRKTAGTGTSTISLPFANSGSVQVNTGTLVLTLTDGSGSFTTASGATLSLNGTATMASGANFSGAGTFLVTAGALTNSGAFSSGALVLNAGTLTFNGAGTATPTSLILAGGTVLGSQAVTVSGPMYWTNTTFGNAGSTLRVTANGGLTFSSSGGRTMNGGTLVNNTLCTWVAGAVTCYNTALFSNAPSGTIELPADGAAFSISGTSARFANAGLLRKTGGTGTSTLTLPCVNSGSVQVNSGTLALTLADGSGSFTTASGTTMSLNGTATLASGASFGGAGTFVVTGGALTNNGAFSSGALVINSGTLSLNGTGTATPTSLRLAGGTLLGSQAVTVSGPLNWTNTAFGNAGSTLRVTANGGLTIGGAGGRNMNGGTLINNSACAWIAGAVTCYNTALFSNTPAGTIDLMADGAAFSINGSSARFANAGLLRKTAGTGTSTISLPFANSGSVQVNSGTLTLTLTDGSGSFTTASGTTLSLNGTATLASGASLGGAGAFIVTAGALTNNGAFTGGALVLNAATLSLNGAGTATPTSLTLSTGTLSGNQAVTVSGPMTWTNTAFGGAGSTLKVTANGGLTIGGAGGRNMNGGTLINNGAGTWFAGTFSCSDTALFSNAPAGTLDLAANGTPFSVISGTPAFANAGTLRKTAGTGTTTIALPCVNTGLVQANTGTLVFSGSFLQTGGQAVLSGGSLSFQTTARLQGGTLSGSGTITGSVSNNAVISPGASPGLLSITGNYTEGPEAHLLIELGGTIPGTGHDKLSVGGTAALAGTLNVSYWNGFTPAPGNVFTALVCNVRSGGFSSLQAPTNNLGIIYTLRSATLEAGNASPIAGLSVAPLQIACHSFQVQGSGSDPDGTVTNISLLLGTNVLASVAGTSAQVTVSYDFPGEQTFTALATDNEGAMGATNIVVSVATLPLRVLDAIGFQTNSSFKLCMAGDAGTNYEIQAGDDLGNTNSDWSALGAMESINGIWRFTDSTATNSAHRLYRARQLP